MKSKNAYSKPKQPVGQSWPKALALGGMMLFSSLAAAWDVSGNWNVTVLTRTDVVPIKAPGLIPEHTVAIADDTYTFYDDGAFSTYGVEGWWTQRKSQYSISVNAMDLENQFRQSLRDAEPGIVIHQLKLLSRKLSGNELDNGIWGVEKFEYRIDSTFDGYRDVVKLVITSNVAGKPRFASSAAKKLASGIAVQKVDTVEKRSPAVDAAVNALVAHMKRRGGPAQ